MGTAAVKWATLFIDIQEVAFAPTARFWANVWSCSLSPARGERGHFKTLVPERGDAFIRTQAILSASPKIHLDIHVAERLASLLSVSNIVATAGGRIEQIGDDLIVCASPAGVTFCLVPWDGELLPLDSKDQLFPSVEVTNNVPLHLLTGERVFWSQFCRRLLTEPSHSTFSSLPFQMLICSPNVSTEFGSNESRSLRITLRTPRLTHVVNEHVTLGARLLGTGPTHAALMDPCGRIYRLQDASG